MGPSQSKAAVADVQARLSRLDLARLHDGLQAAFDAFVEKHCEVAPDAHVSVLEMQSAIVAYMENVGFSDALAQWFAMRAGQRNRYLFEDFGKRVAGVEASGVAAHRVLAGIRVRSWPRRFV